MLNHNSLLGIPRIESPLFDRIFVPGHFSAEVIEIAHKLRRDGYATLRFPDPAFEERAERIRRDLGCVQGRLQDGWKTQSDVRAFAVNESILELLGSLYGRRAIPFQTLNFPVGTQQHVHSDAVHFSCIPERFMCGVWVALEDIHAEAGPLEYYPGSHRWPIYTYEHLGRNYRSGERASQEVFHEAWRDLLEVSGIQRQTFLAKRGDALIWCANLLHGGAPQLDPKRSRWSQVTHYYFEDCAYYTPMLSEPFRGRIAFREITNIASGAVEPNRCNGGAIESEFIRNAQRGEHRQEGASTPELLKMIAKRVLTSWGLR